MFSWLSRITGSALSRLKRAGSRRASERELSALMTSGSGTGILSNAWTDSRVEQVRHFKHWLYCGISRIADRVACQVLNVGVSKETDSDSTKRVLPWPARQKVLAPLRAREDLEHVGHDHPLVRLLADPNEPDTAYDLWYETVLFLELTGSAYWWAPKNNAGLPVALWVLPSHWVWPIIGPSRLIDGYEIRPTEGNYLRRYFPADEVVHFKRKNPYSKIDGYAVTTAVSQWIDVQESVDRSRYFTFKNGAFPSSALEFDPNYQDPSTDDLDRIEAKFLARYAGEARSGRPLLLPPGVKFHKLSLTPREMDYCASAEQLRDNILAALGVPLSVAGVSKGLTYGSVMADHLAFATGTINPLCRWLGQVVTEKVARLYDESLKAWFDDTTPDDPAIIEKQLQTDLQFGVRTHNEARAIRGLKPYAHGGDDPVLPAIGLVLPWGTGNPENAINPFERPQNNAGRSRAPAPDSTTSGDADTGGSEA